MFNPAPVIEEVALPGGQRYLIVDDVLLAPERWRQLAVEHRETFQDSNHNAYPGGELRLPDFVDTEFARFFNQHIRRRFAVRRLVSLHTRLAMVTMAPEHLSPRQWICHRDRLAAEPGSCVIASVLYLFADAELGGTSFFVPSRGELETAQLIHDSGVMNAATFTACYGVKPGYQVSSNGWFEKTATVAPKWNRMIFYDGGGVFHCSDIPQPARLSINPLEGRLTLNGFFTGRRSLAGTE